VLPVPNLDPYSAREQKNNNHRNEMSEKDLEHHKKRQNSKPLDKKKSVGIPALDYITKQQIKWFELVTRMSPNNIPQRALTSRSNNKRQRGRSPKRWINGITEFLDMAYEANKKAMSRTLNFPSTLQGTREKDNRLNVASGPCCLCRANSRTPQHILWGRPTLT
jgi:hypothetical protein